MPYGPSDCDRCERCDRDLKSPYDGKDLCERCGPHEEVWAEEAGGEFTCVPWKGDL